LRVFDSVPHLVLALVEIARQLQIGSYAVPQRLPFSDVARLMLSTLKEVHAGPGRNTIEFGFKNGVHGSSWDCPGPSPSGRGQDLPQLQVSGLLIIAGSSFPIEACDKY